MIDELFEETISIISLCENSSVIIVIFSHLLLLPLTTSAPLNIVDNIVDNNNNNNKDDNNNNNGGGPRWDMEEIKSNVALLLEGKPYEEMHEFCDFTLEEQNEVQVAKGVQPSAPSEFKPVIKKNVSYIVAGMDRPKLSKEEYHISAITY